MNTGFRVYVSILVGFLFVFPVNIKFRKHLHAMALAINNNNIHIHIDAKCIAHGAHSMLLPNWCLSKGHNRIKWPSQQFLQSLYAYVHLHCDTYARRADGNVRCTLAMVMVDFIILNFAFCCIQHATPSNIQH